MSTSSKSSSNLPSLVKQKWQKSKPFRYTINFIVTIGGTEIIALFTLLSAQHLSIGPTLLFALIPALFLWWAVNVMQNYDDKADAYIQDITKYREEIDSQIEVNQKLRNEVEKFPEQFFHLLQETGKTLELYPPFRKLLEKEPGQKKLIGHFTNKSMQNALCIWNISRNEFFELAEEGIRDCKKCQLIHYGSLKDLQIHPYLKALQEKQSLRIVILSEDHIGEMKDNTKIDEFLSKTGNTPSYWIDEERFFRIAELTDVKKRIKLDDCAILDEQLLLLWQHDRKIASLSFKDEKIFEGILRAFKELEQQLIGYSNPEVTFELVAENKKI